MGSHCLIALVGWKKFVFSSLIRIEMVKEEIQDKMREDRLGGTLKK